MGLLWWSCSVAMLLLPLFLLSKRFRLQKMKSGSAYTSLRSAAVRSLSSFAFAAPAASDDANPTPLPSGEYEVFLSFRGPDTRNNIADVLYTFLVRSKIRTFRDDEELRQGEDIGAGLIDAIAHSKVHVPIISRTYASSKWCLQELAEMVECRRRGEGQIILPIFYLVNPKDARHQTGLPFEDAFRLHDEKYDQKVVQKWRDALKEVGSMKGWHVNDSNRLGSTVDKVFETVLSHLSKDYTLVVNELVGIEDHVKAMMNLLNIDDSGGGAHHVKTVAVHGMGGIGKTTIARAVYDKVSKLFDRHTFVEDVREMLKREDGIVHLQNKLISGIMKKESHVDNASAGIREIKDRVCRFKVLVVLDDVDDTFEFERIFGHYENFAAGSRFIVTTRNKKTLNSFRECEMYEPGLMSFHQSLRLFCKYAFRTADAPPPREYEALCREFVLAAAGLPLAIEVLGSDLFREDKAVWEERLAQLKEIPPKMVLEKLKISYNSLTHEEQQIFLDIACFFVGEDKDIASHMWSDCKYYPLSGINVLVLKSLVKIGDDNEFRMHDHVVDLGRSIVREENVKQPELRSRIWSTEEALDVLLNDKGTEHVKAIRVGRSSGHDHVNSRREYDDVVPLVLTSEHFRKLSQLRYLEADGVSIIGNFYGLLQDLRWLRLPRHGESLQPLVNFCPFKLVVLDMVHSYITSTWGGWTHIEMAENLKVLNLGFCHNITYLPDISTYDSLEVLDLYNCFGVDLWELEIGHLKNLKVLDLHGCRIRYLQIAAGGNNIGTLENLQEIDLWPWVVVDQHLLSAIGKLSSLKTLAVRVGPSDSVPDLPCNLKYLIINSPVPNLSDLTNLERLCFSNCDGLEIPFDVHLKLTKLKSLFLVDVTWMINDYTARDSRLLLLPPSLEVLEITDCHRMDTLPNLDNLANLEDLVVNGPVVADEIRGLERLSSLEVLMVYEVRGLRNLTGLERLKRLKYLGVKSCPDIDDLGAVGDLGSLETLQIIDCVSLKRLPDLSKLTRLRTFTALGSPLGRIEGLELLEGLVFLDLSDLLSLESLPSLFKLRNLKHLFVNQHRYSRRIDPVIGELIWLESLWVTDWWLLETLPDLSALSKLQVLNLKGCSMLRGFSGLEGLESLRVLNLDGCISIFGLLDLSGLKNLELLFLRGCGGIFAVEGLDELDSLVEVDVTGSGLADRGLNVPIETQVFRFGPPRSDVWEMSVSNTVRDLTWAFRADDPRGGGGC